MKLIIGLGNPGEKYKYTRHNFGFLALDFLAKKFGFSEFKYEKKINGKITSGVNSSEKFFLLKPETFMNLSGLSVVAAMKFYKISVQDILVIYDDIDINFGEIKFREKGNSGGHNGIKSIISELGTNNFFRIKLGINSEKRFLENLKNEDKHKIPTEKFVLQNFSAEEKTQIPTILEQIIKKI